MKHSFMAMLAAEFIGTAILMIFGNGAVTNVELKNTKGVIGQKVCLLVGVSWVEYRFIAVSEYAV